MRNTVQDVKRVSKWLEHVRTNEIPFAQSRAMEAVTKMAATQAINLAKITLDRPTPVITRDGNRGAIRARWPSKRDIQNNFTKADGSAAVAAVYVVSARPVSKFHKGGSSTLDLTNDLHPNVFGGRITKSTDKGRFVMSPTSALLKGLSGRGRLKKLNKYGNVAGLRTGALASIRAQEDLFLNVEITDNDPKTRHLKPGLYFKGREISKGGARTRAAIKAERKLLREGRVLKQTRRVLGARARIRGGRVRWYLVMLISYTRYRDVDKIYPYDVTVSDSFVKNYPPLFEKFFKLGVADTIGRQFR